MRDYSKISPAFWTGDTGRKLREAGPECQVLALFLLTNPMANMIGLYHLPPEIIAFYIRSPFEAPSEALRRVSEAGFAYYDFETQEVFVPEMAAHQIGDTLDPKDNRVKGVIKEWKACRKSRFFKDFHARYVLAYHLPPLPETSESNDPNGSPFEAPSKPLRRGSGSPFEGVPDQEKEKEKKKEKENPPHTPLEKEKEKEKDKEKFRAAEKTPRKRDELFDAVAEVTASDSKVSGAHIAKVCTALRTGEPPYSAADVRALPPLLADIGITLPLTLGTVEKYIGRVRSPPSAARPVRPSSNGQLSAAEVAARAAAGLKAKGIENV